MPKFVGAVHQIVRMTEPDGAAFAEIARIDELSAEALLDLNQQLMRARANLERLQRAISLKRAGVMRPARRKAGRLRDRTGRSSAAK